MTTSTGVKHRSEHSNGHLSPISEELGELTQTVKSGLHDTAESGKRVMHAMGEAAASTASDVRSSLRRTRDTAADRIAERPFTSIAIAVGVGALLGAALMWRRR